jgi:ABC-type transporter Mla subunit MlaD
MSRRRGSLVRFLDIVPSEHRARPFLIGAIFLALGAVALISAATRHVPLAPRSGEVVHVEFASADQVSPRTVVRVGGVKVGRVEDVEPGSDPLRTSRVAMRITDDSVHLHSDARAAVRWRTVFGGLTFIDLKPGSASAPELGDRALPASRTSSQVEFDQVLQAYSGTTSRAQREVVRGLAESLASPKATAQTLRALAPTLATVRRGLRPLQGTETGDLRRLVKSAGRTISGLDDPVALSALVTGAQRTVAAIDARRADLGRALELLPPSLDETSRTMHRLRTTLGHLDPLATRLRPGARALAPAARTARPALAALDTVLGEARPLLRAAAPALTSLRSASRSGAPLMDELEPTIARLRDELLPFLDRTDGETKLKVYEAIGPFFAAISSAASQYDSIGHRIRLQVVPSALGFVTSPPTDAMRAACARSALPRASARCPKLTRALTRAWFSPRQALKAAPR